MGMITLCLLHSGMVSLLLLPRGEKTKNYVNNSRPISLFNVTYKLASSCIPNHIKNVLPSFRKISLFFLKDVTLETVYVRYMI